GMRRIALDLLAQPVDMRFERMRRDPGVIPPHLAEQRIAADDPVAGAIEIFEDRGFLFGQTHLFAGAAVDHQLGAGLKRVGPDRHRRSGSCENCAYPLYPVAHPFRRLRDELSLYSPDWRNLSPSADRGCGQITRFPTAAHLLDGREEWQACAETAGTPLASAYDITPYEVSLGRTADPPIARLGPSRPSHRRRPFRVAARRAGVALRPGRSRAGPRGGIRQ